MISTWTRECWLPVPTSTIIISAGIEAFLLTIVKNNHRSSTPDALLASTYGALVFFLSATLSGLILKKRFGDDSTQWRYGSTRSWVWVMRHYVISVIAGTMSVIAQVILYGWLRESILVKGALSAIIAFSVLFLAYLVRFLLRN